MSKKLTVTLSILALALPAIGCSKSSADEQKKAETTSAAAPGAATATPTSVTTTTSAGAGGFVGSCTISDSNLCKEFIGALPMGAEGSCKIMEGTFSKTDRCPTDKLGKGPLAATCTIKREGDDRSEKKFTYASDKSGAKAAAEGAKAMCEIETGTFEAVTASAASPAAASPAAKPAAKAAAKKK